MKVLGFVIILVATYMTPSQANKCHDPYVGSSRWGTYQNCFGFCRRVSCPVSACETACSIGYPNG